ncbi:MAG: molybdate ABC transporter substrate-binding protein [Lachnospiraceae bacterium]|nr:molybdate ABC transporter substrate-binding protein [Lachnospiraceae bacterium]
MKKWMCLVLAAVMSLSMAACSGNSGAAQPAETTAAPETEAPEAAADGEEVTIVLAAAASLKYVFDEQLIPMFEEQYPNIKVEGTYDSSGKLQTQIEEGADWDLFFSAGQKQMTALQEAGLMVDDTVKVQVTNELVLIVPKDSELGIGSVQDILKANTIAIGDPADVPVGQYTQKTLEELGLWEQIQEKEISLGTNVTEVLSWVAAGSADCGFTYRTDAMQEADNVEIIEGLAPATYPVGVIASSQKKGAAKTFEEFLGTEEALEQFTAYGFTLPEE